MKNKQGQIQYKTKGFKPRTIVITIVITAILIVGIIAGVLYYRSLNRYTFTEDAQYFINGSSYAISAGKKAIIQDDTSVVLDTGVGITNAISKLPVYFTNSNAILSVAPMSYFTSGIQSRTGGTFIDYFTRIEASAGNVIISKGLKNRVDTADFLYDGDNTYVVLSHCDLKIGEEVIELTPLSYVISVYDSWVAYYDYETSQFTYLDFGDEKYKEIVLEFRDGMKVYCDLDRAEAGGVNFMLTQAITVLPDTL